MGKKNILFVCIHNSARSQMAEAFMNSIAGDEFDAESAGIEPGVLNQLVVNVMREEGIDISGNTPKSVEDVIRSGIVFNYVITVCDEASAERCPNFPGGGGERLHWSFPDPSRVEGTEKEKLSQIRVIRDDVKNRIECWVKEQCL